ncbi:hypothetical protein Tco_0739930, partial [Tanacetum coccineum]
MTTLQFDDTHNLVVFLTKSAESEGFEQIVDFLNASTIKYALTVNPTIYTSCIEQFWSTVKAKTVNGEGEGLDMPTDPHHTPTIIPPSTSQPQRKQRPRKPKRKDTKIPQSSVPVENVADKAVYEERDDSLEGATTTAAGLDVDSGGGPRRQDTMGDTIAQTRSENVSKFSNDPLLTGGRKIHDIDADEDITLENVHDANMFGVHDLDGDEVFIETKEPVANVATTTSTIPVSAAKDLFDVDMTLAQALA